MNTNFLRHSMAIFNRRKIASFFKPAETLEYPLLSELFSIDRLDGHGEAMARMHSVDRRKSADTLLARLSANEKVLTETYQQLCAEENAKRSLSPASVWLLDNFFLIDEQIQLARQHFSRRYSQELPRLRSQKASGVPRVYALVLDLISHVDGLVNKDNLKTMVSSYQRVTCLTLGELWAIPIMLRLALIENLRRIALRIAADRRDSALAGEWAGRMLATAQKDPTNIILDIADMARSEIPLGCAFIAELVRKLQSHNPALALVQTWIEQRLAAIGQTIERQVQLSSQQQATNHMAIGNSIQSLRFLTSIDWKKFVEDMSIVDHTLCDDPAGIYPAMDFATRDRYRHVIEKLAKKSRKPEYEVASSAVLLASQNISQHDKRAHVGYYLIGKGSAALLQALMIPVTMMERITHVALQVPLLLYLGSITLLAFCAAIQVVWGIHGVSMLLIWIFGTLCFFGFFQAAISLVNWCSTRIIPPHTLPKMDFAKGIPVESSTLIAVPTMLSSPQVIANLLNKMEVLYLSNHTDNLYFCLVTDFEDALAPDMPHDANLSEMASAGIKRLNDTYAANGCRPFLFFHRMREWNPSESCWMGLERKRGKLETLTRFLHSGMPDTFLIEGDRALARTIKYVITLDADTDLPRDAALRLIEAMAHPLNAPVYNPVLRRVVDGYAIMQPRVASSQSTTQGSWYARVFGSDTGIDPYTRAVSDVYQDLFSQGSFIGKGIYDVAMMAKVLDARLPQNLILSHDLLEGTYCRSGLLSDIQLIDEFPARYSDDVARRHRWIRGDWQIASWLMSHVPGFDKTIEKNPLSYLSQWKILDNLRRSLLPLVLLLLIVLCWLLLTPPWLGLAVVAAILLVPSLPGIVLKALQIPPRFPIGLHLRTVLEHTGLELFRALFAVIVLPFEAVSNSDALCKTWWRMLLSKKNLLQWTASQKVKDEASKNPWSYVVFMGATPLFTLMLGVLLFATGQANCWPLLLVWFFSPLLPWWISRPTPLRKPGITTTQRDFLRIICRKSWRFFETFAGPTDHWLVADNYQEEPREAVAHRTSPTNIGLLLLSNLGAFDVGYLCAGQLIDTTRKTFATLESLPRYCGHFYNWYDTLTLQPLIPQYVSTVDSGNLAGYLLTLRTGLLGLKNEPIFRQTFYSGLIDTLLVINRQLAQAQGSKSDTEPVVSNLSRKIDLLRTTIHNWHHSFAGLNKTYSQIKMAVGTLDEPKAALVALTDPQLLFWFGAFKEQCLAQQADLLFLAPWLETELPIEMKDHESCALLDENKILNNLHSVREALPAIKSALDQISYTGDDRKDAVLKWFTQLDHQIRQGCHRAQERVRLLDEMALQCQGLANQEYGFLYNESRKLLVIGYDVTNKRQDNSFYDLLASESRLCSFIGIAQGKLPMEHWFALGRLVTIRNGKTLLLSWGGSMFEYLMPQLIMPSYHNTLLGQTCSAIVDRQIAYGEKRGVPWGISESAEHTTDANLNFQYRSFGVPDLGFKRGLAGDLVIAPYATALALMVTPKLACENMQRLEKEGYEGRFGFYEAIDFTPSRMAHEHKPALIRSFMAHHQGMSFVSLVNFFTGNTMVRRFESDPLFAATTLLLQERVPKESPYILNPSTLAGVRALSTNREHLSRIFTTPHTAIPEVHLLSNGHYQVMITNSGGGQSRWNDIAVTRWNDDTTMDNNGTFVYVNDVTENRFWSAAYTPACTIPRSYEAIFPIARAEFRRRDGDIETYTELAISPEDDIEYRRITVTNNSPKSRIIELTSYAEPVLTTPAADAAHPAFSNLFVQTHILADRNAILCSRRPRAPDEQTPWMLHLFTVRGLAGHELSYETDRLSFIGRGLTTRNPKALSSSGPLGGSDGSVLDPIVSIRCRLTLQAGEAVTVGFITGMAPTRALAEALIDKYQDRQLADRVFDLAVIYGSVMLRQLGITEADAQLYGRLASSILYPSPFRRAHPALLKKNTLGQSNLWAYSISGDLPIVMLRIGDPTRIDLAAKMIQAHAYWRSKGLQVDLVIWNEEQGSYRQLFRDQLLGLISSGPDATLFDRKGGVFVLHPDQMSEADQVLLAATASILITDTNGTLADQIQSYIHSETTLPRPIAPRRSERSLLVVENFHQENLLFFNGWGGFTPDGREYVIQIKPGNPTPMPWVNVVANKQFGSVISPGGGYTWFGNAHQFRLTPWYNDPVCDRTGEAFYLRDEFTGRFWSVTPQPAPGSGDYLNRHGFGYSVFEYVQESLKSELWIFVDTEAPVKFWMLKIRNDSSVNRKISATGFLELVLGENRTKTQMHVRTGIDSKTGSLLASNPYNTDFAGRVMFFEVSGTNRSISGDRTEFIGRNGTLSDPAAMHRVSLSGRVGAGFDPAATLQTYVELAPGEEQDIVFILGAGKDLDEARHLILQYRGVQAAHEARDRVWQFWNHTLGAVNISTPDPALDIMANGWLIYQTMSARLWARSGYYQSGGAFGFRDQLQDVMALVHTQPGLIREHLLLCASRQFIEGDVQHWWHPPAGRGVRTMISDDFLWLPFVTHEYVTRTGDIGVLDESVHFLEGRPLNANEESWFDLPLRSSQKETLYGHCKRAVLHALRFGAHGLPLMGSGDWNDGMNLVGAKGIGESVWLAFFLYAVLNRTAVLAQIHGDKEFADICIQEATKLHENIESAAWDGEWYLRAFCDDGTTLGTSSNEECSIDSTVQSWSVLSGDFADARSIQAMHSLAKRLIDHDHGLIKLLDPPFDQTDLEPGYIKGYVPGVRENGGQYTHGAIWAVMAFAGMGESERVKELLSMINPINHGSTPQNIETYKVEPYVMAADIYGAPPHTGRGGWTWYTGSASWMYRLIIESVLGLQLHANILTFKPCIPKEWKGFTIHYRFRETLYHFEFHQIAQRKNIQVVVDGVEQLEPQIMLIDDRMVHEVEIELGNENLSS